MALALGACSGAAEQTRPVESVHRDPGSGLRYQVTPHAEAAALALRCHQLEESCNGLDDDCDAAIDEACGATAAPLEVGVSWNTPGELSLVVDGPGNPVTDIEQQCRDGRIDRHGHAHVAAPQSGSYRVVLRRGNQCNEGSSEAEPTLASVVIRTGGETHGPYNIAVGEEATEAVRIEIASEDPAVE
ncbi:MAG: hypothetical protein AAGF12_40305 [Myxococcota bacterium]